MHVKTSKDGRNCVDVTFAIADSSAPVQKLYQAGEFHDAVTSFRRAYAWAFVPWEIEIPGYSNPGIADR